MPCSPANLKFALAVNQTKHHQVHPFIYFRMSILLHYAFKAANIMAEIEYEYKFSTKLIQNHCLLTESKPSIGFRFGGRGAF